MNECVYQTATSDFQNFEIYEKRSKQIINKNKIKKMEIFSNLKRKRNMCERTLIGVYVYKISSSYHKK